MISNSSTTNSTGDRSADRRNWPSLKDWGVVAAILLATAFVHHATASLFGGGHLIAGAVILVGLYAIVIGGAIVTDGDTPVASTDQ